MEISEALKLARETARKNHDSATLDSVQNVLSAIKNEEINVGKPLTSAEAEAIVARQVKQLIDALNDFTKAGREDLISKTNTEIKLLQSFLPEQLSDEELSQIVSTVLAPLGPLTDKDAGKATGLVMSQVKGRADGSRVRSLVLQHLTKA